jgi:hypothetical protein
MSLHLFQHHLQIQLLISTSSFQLQFIGSYLSKLTSWVCQLKGRSLMTQGKSKQDKGDHQDWIENIQEVTQKDHPHLKKPNCLRLSNHLHLQKCQSWKPSTALTKEVLQSSKVMRTRTIVRANCHLKYPFGFTRFFFSDWNFIQWDESA